MSLDQLCLNLANEPTVDLREFESGANYGEVFTRRWVVEMILDLCGYTSDRDLAAMVLADPACGDGAFVLPILDRLIESCLATGRPLTDLGTSVRAFDLQRHHVKALRGKVEERLIEEGLEAGQAEAIAESWIAHADFLRTWHEPESVDFVVGNPPYIRPEDLPSDLLAEYRSNCRTMSGRADIYIGFFEFGLRLLRQNGVLGFICADRWMRNSYGSKLRKLVGSSFSVEAIVEMHDADAFAQKVAAYPAVTVVRKSRQAAPMVATTTADFDEEAAATVVAWTRANLTPGEPATLPKGTEVARLPRWSEGSASWPTGSPQRLLLLEELEGRFDPIETVRTRVGIGVATGADSVFITEEQDLVESDRLVPLLMTSDIASGQVDWKGRYLVNPWAGAGRLIDLKAYPRTSEYFDVRREELSRRYVARNGGSDWYRTIDPVHADLTPKPKLLFPDMKLVSHPVLDEGGFYPHHNLYYITSDEWDLRVLGGLLLSRIAQFFIESYAVRMRGGTLRFQAQYLRRIRVPNLKALSSELQEALSVAFEARDVESATKLAMEAYGVHRLPD
jgi:adenine-specific DNA-methyltransferase